MSGMFVESVKFQNTNHASLKQFAIYKAELQVYNHSMVSVRDICTNKKTGFVFVRPNNE